MFRKAKHSSHRHLTRVGQVMVTGLTVLALLSAYLVLRNSSPNRASAATGGDPVIAAAGDIACAPGSSPNATHCQQAKTGDVLSSINPSVVLPLGDTQYTDGTAAEYAGSYDQVKWGTNGGTGGYKSVSRPAAGNHEYHTAGATGYYGYFGSNAGDPSKGYYSYDITGPNDAFRGT